MSKKESINPRIFWRGNLKFKASDGTTINLADVLNKDENDRQRRVAKRRVSKSKTN